MPDPVDLPDPPLRRLFRVVATVALVWAGINHFRRPDVFAAMIPPSFPEPHKMVFISGFFEILGGAALLVRRLRRTAGWGLIALLVAVFPANLHMAHYPARFDLPRWALFARLPMQLVLIAWVWWIAVAGQRRSPSHHAICAESAGH